MTFRERLADWISGGEIARRDVMIDNLSRNLEKERESRFNWIYEASRYAYALQDIINMQTPGANATVRRMANRAREALK